MNVVDLLPPAEPAPRHAARCSTEEKRAVMAKALIAGLVFTGHVPTLRELAELVGDQTANSVGTLLGAGIRGKGGMNLYRDRKGQVRVCRDNVSLAAKHARESDIATLLADNNVTEDEFVAMVSEMPSVS